ncbi:hypothetical protein C8T65DRAFT_742968 [Cerioporus squamosus]|nr:hypothetical protein C8T65DRAFT_742968 [Cerioporus squamosus]
MSSQFDPEIVDFYDSYRTAEFVYLASITLIVYDYLVTLESEHELFWRRKVTGASALFFAARYTTLLYVLLSVVNFTISRTISDECLPQSCDMLLKAYVVVQTCQYLPWAAILIPAFAGMRAYALSRKWTIFVAILVLSLAPFAVNLTNFALGMSTGRDVFDNCLSIASTTPMELILFLINSPSGVVLGLIRFQSPLLRGRV